MYLVIFPDAQNLNVWYNRMLLRNFSPSYSFSISLTHPSVVTSRNAFSRQFVSPEAFTSLYASFHLSLIHFSHVYTLSWPRIFFPSLTYQLSSFNLNDFSLLFLHVYKCYNTFRKYFLVLYVLIVQCCS